VISRSLFDILLDVAYGNFRLLGANTIIPFAGGILDIEPFNPGEQIWIRSYDPIRGPILVFQANGGWVSLYYVKELYFDDYDSMTYDKTNNRYLFKIANTCVGYIDSAGFHNGAP